MNFICDDSRTIELPFEKTDLNLNNNFYPEIEQFMQLNLQTNSDAKSMRKIFNEFMIL